MGKDHESDGYQAYLLRLWRARCRGRWQWRVSIENPASGERHGFRTLTELFTFLRERTRQETPWNGVKGLDVDRGSVPRREERHDV
jgi:hypothetical protein